LKQTLGAALDSPVGTGGRVLKKEDPAIVDSTSMDLVVPVATEHDQRKRKKDRKSLGRRVSFAATAHVRLFERDADVDDPANPEMIQAQAQGTPTSSGLRKKAAPAPVSTAAATATSSLLSPDTGGNVFSLGGSDAPSDNGDAAAVLGFQIPDLSSVRRNR
jgi:hypothetical protein